MAFTVESVTAELPLDWLSIIFGVFHWLQSPVFVLGHGVCFMLYMVEVKVTLCLGGSLP